MIIDKELFKDLKYNVVKLKARQKVLDAWPHLKKIPEFNLTFGLNQDLVLRYLFILYDIKTPLLEIENLDKAKTQAATLAGFSLNTKNEFSKKVYEMFRGYNPEINRALIRFCIEFKSHKWETYIVLREKHYRNMFELISDYTNKSKLNMLSVKTDSDMLDEMRNEFINNEPSKGVHQTLHDYTTIALGIRPEDIANNIQEGKKVVDIDPYGPG